MFIGASDEAFTIPSPGEFLMNRHQLIGSDQIGREYLHLPLHYVAKAKVKVMAETFPLNDVADAYQKVANGMVRFLMLSTTISAQQYGQSHYQRLVRAADKYYI